MNATKPRRSKKAEPVAPPESLDVRLFRKVSEVQFNCHYTFDLQSGEFVISRNSILSRDEQGYRSSISFSDAAMKLLVAHLPDMRERLSDGRSRLQQDEAQLNELEAFLREQSTLPV
jgi:hypothetical protein